MDLIKFILACSILVPLTSATYIYRRPIAFSKLHQKSEASHLSERRDQSASTTKKENSHENGAEPNVLKPGQPGIPLNQPLYLVPVKEEHVDNSGANGGIFGAYGALIIPGLHLNLGGNGFGGSLSASGGFSGHYGGLSGYEGHYGGGVGGAHGGGFAGSLITPVHYGYPVHRVGGAGGFAAAGVRERISPFYASAQGVHHKIKEPESSAGASGVLNLIPNGPILGGISPQKGSDYHKIQPEVLLEVSPYQQEGEGFEQLVLPPGYHHPGFIASSAGRVGYPVIMAYPEQFQDLSLRQNPNPILQFFQRPLQFLQMFINPNQGNSSKDPEKPETEKPVVESPVAGKPGTEKPVDAKPNSEKLSVSQSHGSSASVNKVQESKQNASASANHEKKPSGSGASASVPADKDKEIPKPSAAGLSDVIASVNEVLKATSAANDGSVPVLPVFIEEAKYKAREGDVKTALDATAEGVTGANVNVVPNGETAVDIESKPIA